jgi:CO dehydrogenase maturation factor
MTKIIAMSGKGGTGKTTVAAIIIRSLLKRSDGPILAIDADPAANLHLALGLPMPCTVGDIREEMMHAASAGQLGVAISRHDYLTHEVRMSLEEGEKVDLIAMGRPEGQGCYCAVNHLLREIIDDLARNYAYVVIDNEAGMEHLSRRTTKDVDLLLVITDPTIRGLRAASSIAELARDIEIEIRDVQLVVNRVNGELPEPLTLSIDELGLAVAAFVPEDEKINQLDALGQPLIRLEEQSPASGALEELVDRVLENI